MSEVLVLDTWAFVELVRHGAQEERVLESFEEAAVLVLPVPVAQETFNYIVKWSRGTRLALDWLDGAADGRYRVADVPFVDVLDLVRADAGRGRLSFVDYAVAVVARRYRAARVASGDHEFRRLGLDPIFATA